MGGSRGAAEWAGLVESYFFRFRAPGEGPISAEGSTTAHLGDRSLYKNLGLTLPYSVPGVKVWSKDTLGQVASDPGSSCILASRLRHL